MEKKLEKDLLDSIKNPDNQLVADAQRGNMEAEEALIRKYTELVVKKAKAYYMAGADESDVMQEGMIGLLRAVRNFDERKDASFSTFANICVTNQIISAIRSADRIKHKALNTSVSLNKPLSSDSQAGLDGSGENITLEDIISANPADSPEQKLIIKDVTYYILHNDDNIFSKFEMEVLREFMKGYSYVQIADKLKKSPKSVDNALQRCKKKVNDYLWE